MVEEFKINNPNIKLLDEALQVVMEIYATYGELSPEDTYETRDHFFEVKAADLLIRAATSAILYDDNINGHCKDDLRATMLQDENLLTNLSYWIKRWNTTDFPG